MRDQQKFFQLTDFTFKWLCLRSFLYALSLPTILTKHQAFAPSSVISLGAKFRFFRVEFSLRLSAKAWQEKSGPWVHLLNWSNSESFLKIFSHCDVNDSLATCEINKNSFSSLTSLSSDCVLFFLYAPFLLTILTKHQAFAPSAPIWFRCKSRFFRVEFSLRPSAKAWREKSGLWVQLLNWSNSESSQS